MTGEKPHIYAAIEWLLQRREDLKKRAYLARYLVKLEVPAEILQDDTVNDLYVQVSRILARFKIFSVTLGLGLCLRYQTT